MNWKRFGRKYIQGLIEVIFWHFHGGTEEKQEKSQSGWSVFWMGLNLLPPRYKPRVLLLLYLLNVDAESVTCGYQLK
jgi:hypothetical protein